MTARVLVTVAGGAATCYEENCESFIFDWDSYSVSSIMDGRAMRIPNSFRALAIRAGVPYMPGDEDMTASELAAKYGGLDGRAQHPEHQLSHWLNAASVHQTRLGYWDWVVQQIEEFNHE